MFFFGDASASAEMMIQDTSRMTGPGWPFRKREKWTRQDVQAAYLYASNTLRRAVYDELDEGLIQSICDIYEEHLAEFCEWDDVIYRAMKMEMHDFPWKDPGAMARQKHIARTTTERVAQQRSE